MRYFIKISYKGTAYNGWQIQPNGVTVQEKIQKVLSTALRQEIELVGSGRTDTGVHASLQVAHFDTETILTNHNLRQWNGMLPKDISINDIKEVRPTAHARFDAVLRSYEYRISLKKTPFLTDLAYFYLGKTNIDLMNLAAKQLLEHKDFECFSKVKTQKDNFLCDISVAEWIEVDNLLIFKISANRFLRGMVRAIVGTLLEVGTGKRNIDEFEEILTSKNRQKAGFSVPPEGLFLVDVKYNFEV